MLKIAAALLAVWAFCHLVFRDRKGNNTLNRDIDYDYLKKKRKK